MNGYSKMKTISDTKSRSMDFSSDLLSSSSPLSLEIKNPKPENLKTYPEQRINNNNSSNKTQDSFSFSELEEGEEDHQECNINYKNNNGEKFSGQVKLRRNSTVSASSAASHMLQSAVKRAFSMRRSSSSVSESYCRIHDQSVTLASPFEDEDIAVNNKNKKKSSKSKIIKACKKLFGL